MDYQSMTDDELSTLYIEKTELLAKGHGVCDRMATHYGRMAVLREMGALENEIGDIVTVMQEREESCE